MLGELQDERYYDWEQTRLVWESRWQARHYDAPVRMEKSPPNITRVAMLRDNFPNTRFIISWRNPYAQAEGIMRGRRGTVGATTAAWHALSCLEVIYRLRLTPFNGYSISYENICENPGEFIERTSDLIGVKLPAVDPNAPIKVKGRVWTSIASTNAEQIDRIDPRDLRVMSEIFKTRRDIFDHYGYEIL